MSTFSSLKFELILTGDQSGQWGNTTNTNIGTAINEAIAGSVDITFASADLTLTLLDTNAAQSARNLRLNLTGTAGGADRTLTLGSGCQINKPYIVNNGLANAVTIKNTTGTGIAVPAGKTMWLFNNGTNVVDAVSYISSLTLGTALPVTSGGTAQSTYTVGDTLYSSAANTLAKLAGNTTATRKYLVSVGDGTNATAPTWDQIDISTGDITGTLPVANGGTGQSGNLNIYSLIYASGTTAMASMSSSGTQYQVLHGNASGVPVWGAVSLANDITGTLGFTNGGTGLSSIAKGGLIVGSGTNSTAALAVGTNGYMLVANSAATNGVEWAAGSTAISTLGTITTGTWNSNPIEGQWGGTGVNNAGRTISLGVDLVTAGSGAITLTSTSPSNVTLPLTGTLATLDGSEVLSNKVLTAPVIMNNGYISDNVGTPVLKFTTTTSSVNYFQMSNTASFSSPILSVAGADTNISLRLNAKGSGKVRTNTDILVGGLVNIGNGVGAFSSNTTFGENSLSNNSTGQYSTLLGYNTGASIISANYTTAVGYGAGQSINSSSNHTAIGYLALSQISTIATDANPYNGSTAVGYQALKSFTGSVGTGSDCTAVGAGAMYTATSNSWACVAVGNGALYAFDNIYGTAVGYRAAAAVTNYPITAVGANALTNCTGAGNTAVGNSALNTGATMTSCTAVGDNALTNCASASGYCTAIGQNAGGYQTYGQNNTYIGYNTQPLNVYSDSNQIVIGAGRTGKGSNTAFIGGTSGAYNGANVTTWATTSDQRIKRNIVDSPKGLAEIMQLRVRNFQYKEEADMPKTDDGRPVVTGLDHEKLVTGFIAQELQTPFPEAVHADSNGILSVSTDPVIYVLVKAVQELTARLEALEARN